MKKLILHITPHVSGGLGRVLFTTLKNSLKKKSLFRHEFLIIDRKPLAKESIKKFLKYKKNIHIKKNKTFIKNKIFEADIVQVEFWNHPEIYELLIGFKFPASRLILCCHINGFSRPQLITQNVINFSDIFMCASKVTKDHALFSSGKNIQNSKKFRFIKFPVDLMRFKNLKKKKHSGFNVSYIGTLDYHKLHRDFLKMSNSINIPKVKFLICGSGDDKARIENESKKYFNEKFKFFGFVENIKKILEITDVLGYPLNKKHYGTGEQIILESMYAKIPVVAFSNNPEKVIIQNKKNGLLVKDAKDYINTIERLYTDKNEIKKIGSNAHEHILKNFSSSACFNNLEKIYNELLLKKKKLRVFKNLIPINDKNYGSKLFIQSLGDKANEFLKSYKNKGRSINIKANHNIKNAEIELRSINKGSLFQYLYYYPNDPYLNFWAGLISLKDEDVLKEKYKPLPKTTYQCFSRAVKFDKINKEFKYYKKISNI